MSESVVRVEGLGKQYSIGAVRNQNPTLRDAIVSTGLAPIRRLKHGGRSTGGRIERFWALRDIDLEVREGETLGVIGRNGAGKSTLLKLLSSVTEPTEGSIDLIGRVGSLLEVGTGFHPELTGRENIFLNGAILGMRRTDIKAKFDEIVEFSEIGKYLDTPVKRYSSGMYLRLAFAVAAFLEPDILLVDEVLAVGDASFQRKCLGKMGTVAGQGRTVIFVSHNLAAVQSLCDTGVVLEGGRIDYRGPVSGAIAAYQTVLNRRIGRDNLMGGSEARIVSLDVTPDSAAAALSAEGPLKVTAHLVNRVELVETYLNLCVEDAEGRLAIHVRSDQYNLRPTFPPGRHEIVAEIPRLGLGPGAYTVWFRLFVQARGLMKTFDSDRVSMVVGGSQIGGIAAVPCAWSWHSDTQRVRAE